MNRQACSTAKRNYVIGREIENRQKFETVLHKLCQRVLRKRDVGKHLCACCWLAYSTSTRR